MMMFFRVGLIGGMGFDGQGLAYEGTGEARAQVSRLVNPVHPYTAVLS